jgi:hypothetical protein
MENFKNFRLSDEAKMEVEKYFKTTYLNSADVFKSLCNAQEELMLVMQQEENTINVGRLAEFLGFYKGLVEACLVDD